MVTNDNAYFVVIGSDFGALVYPDRDSSVKEYTLTVNDWLLRVLCPEWRSSHLESLSKGVLFNGEELRIQMQVSMSSTDGSSWVSFGSPLHRDLSIYFRLDVAGVGLVESYKRICFALVDMYVSYNAHGHAGALLGDFNRLGVYLPELMQAIFGRSPVPDGTLVTDYDRYWDYMWLDSGEGSGMTGGDYSGDDSDFAELVRVNMENRERAKLDEADFLRESVDIKDSIVWNQKINLDIDKSELFISSKGMGWIVTSLIKYIDNSSIADFYSSFIRWNSVPRTSRVWGSDKYQQVDKIDLWSVDGEVSVEPFVVSSEGKFLKRLDKAVKKYFAWMEYERSIAVDVKGLTRGFIDSVRDKVAMLINESAVPHTMEFDYTADWYAGDFGDKGSCFINRRGQYRMARHLIIANRGDKYFFMKFYSKNGRGVARCIVMYNDETASYYVFNSYGFTGKSFANILANYLTGQSGGRLNYAVSGSEVSLSDRSDFIYVNNERAYVVRCFGNELSDSLAGSGYGSLGIKARDDMIEYGVCRGCGSIVGAEITRDGEGHCMTCDTRSNVPRHVVVCDCCGKDGGFVYIDEHGRLLCREGLEDMGLCDDCIRPLDRCNC